MIQMPAADIYSEWHMRHRSGDRLRPSPKYKASGGLHDYTAGQLRILTRNEHELVKLLVIEEDMP